jgi:4-hydroxybenzoate polyprenyltransferase/geranylgeranylglycerol-phosphate geranylgeranyltransferase
MRYASAIFSLIRWENAVLSALGVVLGAWWVRGGPVAPTTLAAAAAAVGLTAVANAENDYQDRGIDASAHPARPLPSGALRPEHARVVVIVAAVSSLVLASGISLALGVLTMGIILVMLAYSRVLKPRGLVGNITVAVVASLPFAYGAWAAGAPEASFSLVAVAIPLHLAREIAKDLEDAPADAPTRRTLPVAHGPRAARLVLLVALGLFAVSLTPLIASRPRLALLSVPALALTALATKRVLVGARGGPSLYKAAMACAMASLVLSHWHR